MLRRTRTNRALPLIKLLFLATRQVTKPFAKMVISSAADVPAVDRACIAMGRFLLGSTGVLKQEAEKQRAKAEEAAKAKMREAELIAHARADIEERVQMEVDALRQQIIELQAAASASLLAATAAGGAAGSSGGDGAPSVPSVNANAGGSSSSSAATASTAAAAASLCPSAAYCPALPPSHKRGCPIGGGSDVDVPSFPPQPRIEVAPFTIPVESIVVPLGDLSEAVKARGGMKVAVEGSGVGAEGSPAGGAAVGGAAAEDGSAPQFASAATGAVKADQPLPTDADLPFRVSAVPNIPVTAADSADTPSSSSPVHADNANAAAAGLGITLTGGAAAIVDKRAAIGTVAASQMGSGSSSGDDSSSRKGTKKDGPSCSHGKATTATGGAGSGGTANRGFSFHKSINAAFQERYYSPVSDDTLRKAGAEILVEFFAFTILSMMLTYEYFSSKRSEQAREKAQLERLKALEEKVNEIASKVDDVSIKTLAVGSGELDRRGSILGRMFSSPFGGGGRHGVDDASQTEGDGGAAEEEEADESGMDMHQRMLQRGLTP